jgi:hypothetical protein
VYNALKTVLVAYDNGFFALHNGFLTLFYNENVVVPETTAPEISASSRN